MRTTLDLPDDILKRAKIVAVERGTTLRELVGQALVRELAQPATQTAPRRGRFPYFPSARPGHVALTNAQIAALEVAEDIQNLGRIS